MIKEMYVSSTPHETKVALVEDDQLSEIFFERENEYTLAGSIYKGRVTRVLPGMQSAFVDIGLERDAFLYVSDFLELPDGEENEFDEIAVTHPEAFVSHRPPQAAPRFELRREPAIAAEAQEDGHEIGEVSPEGNTQEFAEAEANGEEHPAEAGERFRGNRRRRRGRRGRGFPENKFARSGERDDRAEASQESPEAEEDTAPEAAYERVVLPGESLSKYQAREAVPPSSEAQDSRVETESAGAESAPAIDEASRQASEPAPERSSEAEHDLRSPGEYQSFQLPGESIAKYQSRSEPQKPSSGPAGADRSTRSDRPERAPATEQRRPSSEREPQSYAPSSAGFAVLPGESIAKYRNAPAPTPAQTEALSREQAEHAAEQAEQHAEEAATFVIESEPWAETLDREERQEPAQPESSEQQRLEQMNVAAVFGGGVTEGGDVTESPAEAAGDNAAPSSEGKESDLGELDERTQTMIIGGAFGDVTEDADSQERETPESAGERAQSGVAVTPESLEPAAPSAPAVEDAIAASPRERDERRFGRPGAGTLEHEEIEGEEEEHGFQQLAEKEEGSGDYSELEEETLDAGAAAHPVNSEAAAHLTEAVEESETDRAAMEDAFDSEDEAKFDEDATEFEEEELFEGEETLPEEQQEEAIGRAEVRAPAGTAGFQRTQERAPFERRGFRRSGGRGRVVRRRESPRQQVPISDLLKEGQEVLVQIAKEPIGKKGARITSHIALPGRFLVYMPTVNHIGVSRKISSDEERQRLKSIMISEREGGHGGFIVRTAAAGVGDDELRADIRFLKNLWAQIKQRAESSKPPALIYHDLNLVERILRDQVTSDFSQVWVDTEQEYERILNFANRFQPALVRRVKLYTREMPLFEQFGIQEEINKALRAKVWLKSGGYIVINQTEALVAIDINTGKYVGKTARLEDTIVKTNVDAIKEIVRQIRLRDLGGIIVIDFIDMDERKNRQKVMQALEEALKGDRAPSKVLAFNDFGLVAITRKRVKQSLERTLGDPCPYCTGNGFVKSVTTVCNEIFVELRKISGHLEKGDIVHLRVNPEVAKALKADKGRWLADFEELTRRTVLVKADPMLHQEQFDVHG